LSQLLGSKIANIFAWEIDFFLLRPGDSFKVIYDELYIGDEFYTVGRVHTAEFQHRGRNRRAYYFEKGEQDGYFDEEGNSLQRALLKAPFKYNQRVSSGFSHNRFHPILKERRPHHGVDYAAPRGTPIIAIGDGVVTEARKRGGNGNIVQIRHNNRYKSAYLHLNGFASGIRSGARVEQGQVIGFVGRTGLATGYHLCYRLYVNDQPVNSLTIELPASESLEEGFMDEFTHKRIEYDRDLAGIADSERGDTFSSVVSVGGRN
ncbi:MAG: peptidoglycan DD-metalloendopeptidase family protein, partial [Balneolaceae bacterium]